MLIHMLSLFTSQSKDLHDRGAVAGEYAVLLALIAVGLVTILGLFTTAIIGRFQVVINLLP